MTGFVAEMEIRHNPPDIESEVLAAGEFNNHLLNDELPRVLGAQAVQRAVENDELPNPGSANINLTIKEAVALENDADEPEHEYGPDVPSSSMDIVDAYLEKASRAALLRPEEEKSLSKRIEKGDMEAKNKLIESNLRLVASIAKGYVGKGLDYIDLVQEGNLGLIRAVEKFDWRKGCRFSTYAVPQIRHHISRGIVNRGSAIHRPDNIHDLLGTLNRYDHQGKDDTEIMEAMEIDRGRLDELRAWAAMDSTASLDKPVGSDGDSATLGEMIAHIDKSQRDVDPVFAEVAERLEVAGSMEGQEEPDLPLVAALQPVLTPAGKKVLSKIVAGDALEEADKSRLRKLRKHLQDPSVKAIIQKFKPAYTEPLDDHRN